MKMKIKNQLKAWMHSPWFPYVLLLAVLLVWHVQFNNSYGDDDYFASVLREGRTAGAFMRERYLTWSSRALIEGAMVCIAPWIWIFRVLNALVLTGMAVFSARLVQGKTALVSWGLCAMVMLLPEGLLNSAGWIATQMNYTWPALCALIALLPLRRALCAQRVPVWEALASVTALLFAANQEQFCVALLAILAAGIVKTVCAHRRMPWLCLAQLMLTILSLVVIALCPGNKVRYQSELSYWFPGYEALSLLNKIELGFSSTGYTLVMQNNVIFAGFALLLATLVWIKRKDVLSRAIGAAPAAAVLLMGFFPDTLERFLPHIGRMRMALQEIEAGAAIGSVGTMVPNVFLGALFLCVVFGLLVALDREKGAAAVYVLCIGMATRMMMGFSPTIWASGERTFVPLYTVLIALAGLILREIGDMSSAESAARRITSMSAVTIVLCLLDKIA